METARLVTSLPEQFHYRGEPNAWVRMTRPGQHLHSFLEGLTIAPDGSSYVADVPHGRIFYFNADSGDWSEALNYPGEPHGLALLSHEEMLIADYAQGILHVNLSTRTLTPL